MKVRFMPKGAANRWLLVSVFLFVAGLGALAASCAGTDTRATTASATSITQAVTTTSTTTLPPTTSTTVPVAMSKAEIAQRKTEAIAFDDRFYGAWPDADATFTQFADDAAFYDPSNGDFLVEGKKAVVEINRGFFNYFPDIKVHQKAMYLSADGAANRLIVDAIWPPWVPEPTSHAPVGTLEVFGFRNGLVTRYEEWFWARDSRDARLWSIRPG